VRRRVRFVGAIGSFQSAVVSDIFALRSYTVDARLGITELAVFIYDALGHFFEAFFGIRGHPGIQRTVEIELDALIVETVRQLVAHHNSKASVIDRLREIVTVERLVENGGWECDGVAFRLVPSIDDGRRHKKLQTVPVLRQLFQLKTRREEDDFSNIFEQCLPTFDTDVLDRIVERSIIRIQLFVILLEIRIRHVPEQSVDFGERLQRRFVVDPGQTAQGRTEDH